MSTKLIGQQQKREQHIDQYAENVLHTFNEILNIHAPKIEVTISKNEKRRKAKP